MQGTSPQALHAAFEAFYQTLNPEQRQAVDQLDGPLMVVAGPGTGKTQVLAARIGRILLETDTPAASILCLTFSDAGAHAMRQRLLQLIGPEAHRVSISTFHSFCNRVIQDNLAYFGNPHLSLITDLERIDLVRQLLLDQPLDHPLRALRKDPFAFESQLRDLFAVMKKEGWKTNWVEQHIDAFVTNLERHPNFIYKTNSKYGKKGEPKTKQIEAVLQQMERLRAAVRLYPDYESTLEKAFRYEYDDMLLWVIEAFDRHEGLLRTYQERFLYILVDEYQDTNGAQFRILQQLIDYWEAPNVFIVGDDDQSVFEFQGARLQNLLDFQQHYSPNQPPQVLVRNYRSGQNILNAAGRLIGHNQLRAVLRLPTPIEKNLLSQTADAADLQLYNYENRLHEWSAVANQIEALVAHGTAPEHIAVLYTRHKQGEPLQRLLQQKQLPTQLRRQTDVLQLPLIEQFLELLQYLKVETTRPFDGEGLLFRLLHAPYWNIPPIDLALIALYRQESTEAPRDLKWRLLLQSPEHLADAGVRHADRLLEAGRQLENWIAQSTVDSLSVLLSAVWTQSGLQAYVLRHPDRVWLLQALSTFEAFVAAEGMRRPGLRLPELLHTIERMLENRLELPMQNSIQPREGVHLLTAHAAKGLEFDHVFMPDCSADAWEPSAKQRGARFSLPDNLLPSGEEDGMEARRRLFYVAMTRARKGLYLSHSRHDGLGKAIERTRFLDETGLPTQFVPPDPAAALAAQHTLLQHATQPMIHIPESPWLDRRLEQYTLSITALNRYLRCPVAFYYEDILRVPAAMRPAAAFGQAVHAALQHYFLRQPAGSAADALLLDFEAEMKRRRGFFAPDSLAQQVATGKGLLSRFHQERSPAWNTKAVVERRIDRCVLNGVPLTGAIDRIEWLADESLALIDFKTGRPDPKKVQAPSEKNPHGGEFWRQLVFYATLLRASNMYPGAHIQEGSIAWIEPDVRTDQLMHKTIVYQNEDLALVEQLIGDVYANIQAKAFDTGCGKPDCTWCRLQQAVPETMSGLDEVDVLDDEGYLTALQSGL